MNDRNTHWFIWQSGRCSGRRIPLWLWLLVLSCLIVTTAQAELVRYSLSGDMPDFADISAFRISPDGSRVVYLADKEVDGNDELYSVPLLGGGPEVKLNTPFPEDSPVSVRSFEIAPDSKHLVYEQEDAAGTRMIFSVPLTGGPALRLNLPDEPDTPEGLNTYYWYYISPDSRHVVYKSYYEGDNGSVDGPQQLHQLYSVAITNGPPVKLSGPPDEQGGEIFFLFSPDGSHLLYNFTQNETGLSEFYSVPVSGGSAVRVNIPAEADDFKFTGDGRHMLYTYRSNEWFNTNELYMTPMTGGQPIKLFGEEGTYVYGYEISPDDGRVIFVATDKERKDRLYSKPLAGGPTVQLSSEEHHSIIGDDYNNSEFFQISGDGSRVIYRADRQWDEVYALYSVPLTGGTVVPLDTSSSVFAEKIDSFEITPDNRSVIYSTRNLDESYSIKSAPLAGGLVPEILKNTTFWFRDPTVSPDSRRVIYSTYQELFSLALQGDKKETILNGPLPDNSRLAWDYVFSPDGRVVVYPIEAQDYRIIGLISVYDDAYQYETDNGILQYVPSIISGAVER